MKKFLLVILLIIISSPIASASKVSQVITDETFQSIYGETRTQFEQRKKDKEQLYKNEISRPTYFGKKGYFKRLRYKRALKKKLKKLHLM